MIRFSCKKISKKDLLKCTFALNKTEYNVLNFLLKKEGEYTTIQISEPMELDRTTIQKAIRCLVDKKLVNRKQKNISGGGYTFLYTIINRKQIKNRVKKTVRNWCKGIEESINEI